jgi:hypothetical protein
MYGGECQLKVGEWFLWMVYRCMDDGVWRGFFRILVGRVLVCCFLFLGFGFLFGVA